MRVRLLVLILLALSVSLVLPCARGEGAYPALAATPTVSGVTIEHDLQYASYLSGTQQYPLLLDLYLPDASVARPVPLLLFLHGGGWFEGSKDSCPGTTFAQNGYAVACVDYRLGQPDQCPSEFVFPTQIHDVKAAVRWLRQHAVQYGLDATRFGALGNSSGGHLAALLGVSAGVAALEGTENLGASDEVQAVADWYGPVDVKLGPPPVFTDDPCTTSWEYLDTTYGGESTPYFYWTYAWGVFLGGGLADPAVLARADEATPLAYVDGDDPPFLVIHGEADGMVPIAQSEALVSELSAKDVAVSFYRLPGVGHGYGGSGQEVDPAFLNPTLAFFDQHLRPDQPASLKWVRLGGPSGGLGYDIRYSFDDWDTWYVTDAYAGLHISTDGGLSWQPSNNGIPAQAGQTSDGRPVFSLTVDPHDPQIVWAGTDKTGSVYKSTDGGLSWQPRQNGITITYDTLSFRGFTVSPDSSDVVYAMAETTSNSSGPDTTGGVVYRTTNGGDQWEVIWDGGMPSSLARYMWIDPRDTDVLYVSTGIFDRGAVGEGGSPNPLGGLGVLKSIDGGQTWDTLDEANGLRMLYIGSLYMHPQDPDVLLAAAGHDITEPSWIAYLESLDTPPNGIYRTDNGGETWTQVLVPPSARLAEAFSAVEICPEDPDIAYAGSDLAIYRSENAGQDWDLVAGGAHGWGPPGVLAMWPIDLQCDPADPNRLFANNYMGGAFLSEDGGRTWRNASQGYTGAQVIGVAVHPTKPARVYAAGRSGIWRSDNGGDGWYGIRYLSADYPFRGVEWGTVAIDPSRPEHMLAGEASIVESWNGGKSWTYRWSLSPESVDQIPAGMRISVISSIVFAPSDALTVYASIAERECLLVHEPCAAGVGVLRSEDGGTTWEQTSTAEIGLVGVVDLAVDPANDQLVWAATKNGLYRTANGGDSWSLIAGLPVSTTVRVVAIDPTNTQHMLAGVEGLGTYASFDGGTTWDPSYAGLEANGSLHDIVFDPLDPQIVYTSDALSGVYRSTNGGQNWTKINSGLSNRAATGLAITGDGAHVYAATNGEGVFRLDLNGEPPVPQYDAYLPLVIR
jgi:acetyl esterase/lipase/photosystem II stability/assembly factor-like uncharacterized protein